MRENPDLFNSEDRWIYLGIHDFDKDETPELIIGDDISLAVFTFRDGLGEKIADLYYPDTVWCVNGVYFNDGRLNVQCNGAGVSTFVNFGFIDGGYVLGLYDEMTNSDVIINGEVASLEEMNQIYPLNSGEISSEERRKKIRMIYENGEWVVYFSSGDNITVDASFDFERVLW